MDLNRRLNETQNILVRALLYGAPGTKKTWWAGRAAEAGFNVILLDADDGWHIWKNIGDGFKHKLKVLDIVDTFDEPKACVFMTMFLKGDSFIWDENKKRQALTKNSIRPDHDYTFVDAKQLTPNDVLVIDSWTKLTESIGLRYAVENGIDLSDATKPQWEGYRWSGALASWMLQKLHALPCHVIVIGHEQNYEKRKEVTDERGRKQQIVEWAKTQVISTSGPHSQKLGVDFSELYYFYRQSASVVKIDTKGDKDRDGKSRLIEPGYYRWEELQFKDIVEKANLKRPNVEHKCTGFISFPAGIEIEDHYFGGKNKIENRPLSSGNSAAESQQPKKSSLAGLMKR